MRAIALPLPQFPAQVLAQALAQALAQGQSAAWPFPRLMDFAIAFAMVTFLI